MTDKEQRRRLAVVGAFGTLRGMVDAIQIHDDALAPIFFAACEGTRKQFDAAVKARALKLMPIIAAMHRCCFKNWPEQCK